MDKVFRQVVYFCFWGTHYERAGHSSPKSPTFAPLLSTTPGRSTNQSSSTTNPAGAKTFRRAATTTGAHQKVTRSCLQQSRASISTFDPRALLVNQRPSTSQPAELDPAEFSSQHEKFTSIKMDASKQPVKLVKVTRVLGRTGTERLP